jgi:hypothetical protein
VQLAIALLAPFMRRAATSRYAPYQLCHSSSQGQEGWRYPEGVALVLSGRAIQPRTRRARRSHAMPGLWPQPTRSCARARQVVENNSAGNESGSPWRLAGSWASYAGVIPTRTKEGVPELLFTRAPLRRCSPPDPAPFGYESPSKVSARLLLHSSWTIYRERFSSVREEER